MWRSPYCPRWGKDSFWQKKMLVEPLFSLWIFYIGADVLPNLLADKWGCHSFLETQDSCVRDGQFFNHSNSSTRSISICVASLCPGFHRAVWRGLDDPCTCSGLCYRRGTLSLGNLNLTMGSKYACPVSRRERLPLLYRTVDRGFGGRHYLCLPSLFTVQTFLKRYSRIKPVPLLTRRMCGSSRDPWRIISQHQIDPAGLG